MITRISEHAGKLVKNAILRNSHGDDIAWDATYGPGPEGQGSLFVTLQMKGTVLGTVEQMNLLINNPALLTQEDADNFVRQGLEAIREKRSATLAEQQEKPSSLLVP